MFRTYEHLMLYIIPYISHVLIIFYINQTIHLFPKKFKFLRSKFRKCFSIKVEIKQFQVFSLMLILIISRINRSYRCTSTSLLNRVGGVGSWVAWVAWVRGCVDGVGGVGSVGP